VVKTDAVVDTVHVVGDEPPGLVARKALRVNLSDLAGKGAVPFAYMLALATGARADDAWVRRFAAGLKRDQEQFGLALIGGDSVTTPGPSMVAITVFGWAHGRVPRRGDARAGDDVYVSGTIGDGALGLLAARGALPGLTAAQQRFLLGRYQLPQPRLALGQALAGVVRAAMDISDGLVADLAHIGTTSRLRAVIAWDSVPLSPAARRAVAQDPRLRDRVLGGGDDYELLFTAPKAARSRLASIARRTGIAVTRIGAMQRGSGVRVLDAQGRDVTPKRGGYEHR
jgi:thiamine-monophosphate kinase